MKDNTKSRVRTFSDIVEDAGGIDHFLNPSRWGNWHYDKKQNVLRYVRPNGSELYELPLDEATTAAQVLDWIMQLREKSWLSDRDIRDVLTAFRDLLNPQRNPDLAVWGHGEKE
jgi:hypothetical protein